MIALSAVALAFAGFFCADPNPFAIRRGDRVVLLGGGLVERDRHCGYFEAALAELYAMEAPTFRNLGWSGDTVFGDARAGFGTPEEGFQALVRHVNDARPAVLFVAYGGNEAFEGSSGLTRFEAGLVRLLEAVERPALREIVLLAPLRQEAMGPPFPDPAAQNVEIAAYGEAIRRIAESRRHRFLDLNAHLFLEGAPPLTDDGFSLTERGYEAWSGALVAGLGLKAAGEGPAYTDRRNRLRGAIREKNELFFHRWRPQNETYLFGFRKHEQGGNAREIPGFDPLIEAKEREVARIASELAGIHRTERSR